MQPTTTTTLPNHCDNDGDGDHGQGHGHGWDHWKPHHFDGHHHHGGGDHDCMPQCGHGNGKGNGWGDRPCPPTSDRIVRIGARTISATVPATSKRNALAGLAALSMAVVLAGGLGLVVRRRVHLRESWRRS